MACIWVVFFFNIMEVDDEFYLILERSTQSLSKEGAIVSRTTSIEASFSLNKTALYSDSLNVNEYSADI